MFPHLPSELLIAVLECAAASDGQSAYSLCLVASWVQQIAERYLYATIETNREGDARLFERWIAQMAQDGAPIPRAKHVRRLWLHGSCPASKSRWIASGNALLRNPALLARLVQLLPRLKHVGWTAQHPEDVARDTQNRPCHLELDRVREALFSLPSPTPTETAQNETVSLQRASDLHVTVAAMPWIPDVDKDLAPICDAVTHLRVREGAAWPVGPEHARMARLPCWYHGLTHISFGYSRLGDAAFLWNFAAELEKNARAEMIVLEVAARLAHSEWTKLLGSMRPRREADKRLFLVLRCDPLQDDWESEGSGRESIWERAKAFTARVESGGWAPLPGTCGWPSYWGYGASLGE